MLIYLHGFRSSPASFKARMLAEHMTAAGLADQYACPALPPSPRAAVEQVRQTYALTPQDTLVGSSLGGFYATWLAERTGCRAALLNPVVHAARDLASQVGDLRTWHEDQPMRFEAAHVRELAELETPLITFPNRYLLIAAMGDELLDWREMIAHYPQAQTHVLPGSDHGLSDFADHLPAVLAFAGYGAAIRVDQREP